MGKYREVRIYSYICGCVVYDREIVCWSFDTLHVRRVHLWNWFVIPTRREGTRPLVRLLWAPLVLAVRFSLSFQVVSDVFPYELQ